MASGKKDTIYTLYGFDNELDWRRTCFLEPLPPSRYCTYCSRVCATMMMLPCCHIICAGCYSQCTTRSYTCALDAQTFRQQDVAVMPFTIPDLAARHIKCWNAKVGCTVSGPSFLILEHFHKDCLYHSVRCSRCGQAIPHGDVIAHLALGCGPGKSQQPLFPQNKPGSLLGGTDTIKKLEPEAPAASRHLNAARQDLLLTHDQHPKLERGDVAPSLTAFASAGHYRPTTISPILPSSGAAARGPKPHSDHGGKQASAAESYTPAAVVRYLYEQLPSATHDRPSYVDRHNDLLTGRKALSFCSDAELTDNLLCLSPTVVSIPGPSQEGSVQEKGVPSDSKSASPETAPPGSHQYPHVAAILTSGTLSFSQPNSGRVATSKIETPNTAAERVEHASEGETAATQELDKTEESNSSEDRPALVESDLSPEGGSGRDAEALVPVSVVTDVLSASISANGESLSSLLHEYLNEIGRFVRMIVAGIDVVREALGKLMPEELVFVLKACEEVRAQLRGESTVSSTVTDQIKRGTTHVLQAVQKQGQTTGTDDAISKEYVAEKIDHLISLGKHVLRQRVRVSVPVQWYLEGWSELKERALAVGEAADFFHDISTPFFGYVIVPGLMLENTAGTLRLRFTFYVRRGIFDNFLEWPLDKKLTLSVLHHTDKGKMRVLTVDTKRDLKEKCIKPGSEITKPSLSSKTVKADYFDKNGYVAGDKLLLKFEAK